MMSITSGDEVGGISNIYIDSILSKLPLLWNGVYSSDNIPHLLLRGTHDFIIVVNFSRAHTPGSHFITLCRLNHEFIILDSLATYPGALPPELRSLLRNSTTRYAFNYPIQDILSHYCGFYCIYFVLHLNAPSSLQELLDPKIFSVHDLLSNDAKCLYAIKTMINYYLMRK